MSVATRVVRDLHVTALVALDLVASESSCAAADNGAKGATLLAGNRPVVLSKKVVSVLPDDVGQLWPTSSHELLVAHRCLVGVEEIERARDCADDPGGDVQVASRCLQA